MADTFRCATATVRQAVASALPLAIVGALAVVFVIFV